MQGGGGGGGEEEGEGEKREENKVAKYVSINNHLKSLKCSNQKTSSSRIDTKTRPIYMLYPRNPPQFKRYTQSKSKGIEKDISSERKWKKNSG